MAAYNNDFHHDDDDNDCSGEQLDNSTEAVATPQVVVEEEEASENDDEVDEVAVNLALHATEPSTAEMERLVLANGMSSRGTSHRARTWWRSGTAWLTFCIIASAVLAFLCWVWNWDNDGVWANVSDITTTTAPSSSSPLVVESAGDTIKKPLDHNEESNISENKSDHTEIAGSDKDPSTLGSILNNATNRDDDRDRDHDVQVYEEGEDSEVKGFGCTWSNNHSEACSELLVSRIRHHQPLPPQRWLFLGDSTIIRLMKHSNLGSFVWACQCSTETFGRCDRDLLFQMNRTDEWVSPISGLEGPTNFGKSHPFCTDCSRCDAVVMICGTGRCDAIPELTGSAILSSAYIPMEFARDVEFQSSIGLRTTQENLQRYLQAQWNTHALLSLYHSQPVCVVGAGIHDMGIVNITDDTYRSNVAWYLTLLTTQCNHILWITNTTPKGWPNAPQTRERINLWNRLVYDVIQGNPAFRQHAVTWMDVFDESLLYNHVDNIHMENSWYEALGSFLIDVIEEVTTRH